MISSTIARLYQCFVNKYESFFFQFAHTYAGKLHVGGKVPFSVTEENTPLKKLTNPDAIYTVVANFSTFFSHCFQLQSQAGISDTIIIFISHCIMLENWNFYWADK